MGAFDRGFEMKDTLSTDGAQKREHEPEKIEKIFFLQALRCEKVCQRAPRILDDFHRVCGEKGGKRRAADDEDFERLPENTDMAAHADESAQHSDEEERDSDDE